MQSRTRRLPADFDTWSSNLLSDVGSVVGYLAPNEMRFLALLAAYPCAEGDILEIGSFKGKSTIILAKASALAGSGTIVNAVDPMTAPCETDPSLEGSESSLADFRNNIARHNVGEHIRLHQMLSHDLASFWNRPLRLLWIDGDHTYDGTLQDFRSFAPHLADKGIVAIHDVLHQFEGGPRVFLEEVLRNPNFGSSGFCGSIAWAQFHADPKEAQTHSASKKVLAKKLERLLPFLSRDDLSFFEKKKYKFFRWLVPHGAVQPQSWTDRVH